MWDVCVVVYVDVIGDGMLECVLSVWWFWKDWFIVCWLVFGIFIILNYDVGGDSFYVVVFKLLLGGKYCNIWVGSVFYWFVMWFVV